MTKDELEARIEVSLNKRRKNNGSINRFLDEGFFKTKKIFIRTINTNDVQENIHISTHAKLAVDRGMNAEQVWTIFALLYEV